MNGRKCHIVGEFVYKMKGQKYIRISGIKDLFTYSIQTGVKNPNRLTLITPVQYSVQILQNIYLINNLL